MARPAASPSRAARACTPVPGSLRVGKCHPRALCGLVWGAQCSLKSRGQSRAGESSTPSTQLQQTQIKLPDEKIRNDPCLSGVSPREKSRLDHTRGCDVTRTLAAQPDSRHGSFQGLVLESGPRRSSSNRGPEGRLPEGHGNPHLCHRPAHLSPRKLLLPPSAPTCCPPCKSEQQRVPAASCCGAGSDPVPPVYTTPLEEKVKPLP